MFLPVALEVSPALLYKLSQTPELLVLVLELPA